MEPFSVVGKSLPRIDSPAKSVGEAVFASDFSLPGMLYGKILRSPYAHARIVRIDTGRAKRVQGVKAIVTGRDTFGLAYGNYPPHLDPELNDKEPLVMEKARFRGDELAAVAASDEDAAQEALELIEVEYEELPAVFTPEEAMAPQAPLIHKKARNISWEVHLEVGDISHGFQQADHTRQDTFTTPRLAHCALESHACVASFDSSGRLSIWAATQSPTRLRIDLAELLKIPESKVRVIQPHLGGGFGSRSHMFSHEYCSALLSQKTGRPVKIVFSQEEVFCSTFSRHPMSLELTTGVRKDGKLTAMQSRVVIDNGAYNGTGPLAAQLCAIFMHGVYYIPNIKCDVYLVYTNNPIGGPMRGHGAVQPRFAAESQMAMIARDLGMDPGELMLKNAVAPGQKLSHGMEVTSCGLSHSIEKAAKLFTRVKRPEDGGLGLACHSFQSGVNVPYASHAAIVKIHEDGGISLLVGATDVGQGAYTVLSQIVAEEFGVGLEDIRLVMPDTEITPLAPGTFSSRVTLWTGNAVQAAARDAREQLFEFVAEELEANPGDLVARDRRIWVKGSPDKALPMEEAIKRYQLAREGRPILGRGYFSLPLVPRDLRTAKGNLSPAYSFGSTAAQIEVDRETGRIKVEQILVAHDCGRAINPMAVEGQLEGCAAMGLGSVLSEEMVLKEGQCLNPSFLDYRLPLACDIPPVETAIVETIDPVGPFGAKEAGEGAIISVAPAIANALEDAIGIRINTFPLRPHQLLARLA